MTLADFQPQVEAALTVLEWATARARWRQGLLNECDAIAKALPLAGQHGVEAAPLLARLAQIATELNGDVTADQVPVSALRSVPMDLITAAVVRRVLKLPPEFPILSLKTVPSEAQILDAVAAIASRWQTPHGQAPVLA